MKSDVESFEWSVAQFVQLTLHVIPLRRTGHLLFANLLYTRNQASLVLHGQAETCLRILQVNMNAYFPVGGRTGQQFFKFRIQIAINLHPCTQTSRHTGRKISWPMLLFTLNPSRSP